MYRTSIQNIHEKEYIVQYNPKKKNLSGCRSHLVFALVCLGSNIIKSPCLIPSLSHTNTQEGLIHQVLTSNLLKIATKGDIQVSIKELDLDYGLVKSLYVLLDRLPLEVLGLPHFSSQCFFEFGHLDGVGVLLILHLAF